MLGLDVIVLGVLFSQGLCDGLGRTGPMDTQNIFTSTECTMCSLVRVSGTVLVGGLPGTGTCTGRNSIYLVQLKYPVKYYSYK